MRTPTIAAAITAAALLSLTACGSTSGNIKQLAAPSSQPATTAAPSTPAPSPTFDPDEWRFRIGLTIEDLDNAQDDCQRHPSSATCATALKSANDTITEMATTMSDSGAEAGYPATADHLQIVSDSYDSYVALGCEGDPAADKFGSQCRVAVAGVSIGVATVPMKMTLDG